jgi:hypothetical protein
VAQLSTLGRFAHGMNIKHPLKRPYLALLFISIVCLVLGFAGIVLPKPEPKSVDIALLICVAGVATFVTGIITFVIALLWMTGVGLVSGFRAHNRDR